MGGWPPLGYEVEDRRLVVVEREAALVRRIFDRFAKTGSALSRRARAERRGRGDEATPVRQWRARRQALDQGRGLQGARQPRLPRRGGAQGRRLPRRARGDHRPAHLGQGACGHGRARAPTRRRDPGAGPGAPEGPDLRPERPAHVAEPHPPARPDLPLLRDPRGDRGRLRYLPGDERAGRRRRGRGARSRPEAAGRAGAGRADLGGGEARGRGRDHRARGHRAARRLRHGLERAVPRRAGAHRPAPRRAGRRAGGRTRGADQGRGAGEPGRRNCGSDDERRAA